MNRHIIRFLSFAAIMLAIMTNAQAQLPDYADVYYGAAGYGLTGHFIDSDNLIDLVTTHEDEQIGGKSWLNYYENEPGNFMMGQTLPEGREAKFGRLLPNTRWYLAIPDGSELNVYKVDQTNWELDLNQQITDYGVDFLYWGHVNGDIYGDVVATEYGPTHRVVIYHGNQNGTLDDPPHTFDPGCDTDQLALVRMDYYWGSYGWKWDLLAVDGGSSNNIKLFPNNGSGSFTTTGMQTLNAGDGIRDFALGDLDHDGYHDLVLVTHDVQAPHIKSYLNTTNGTFATTPTDDQEFDYLIDQVALGDYNHDGYPDLVMFWFDVQIDVYLNKADGSGEFDFSEPIETGWITSAMHVVANELMFVDLGGNSLYSVAVTGISSGWSGDYPGLWVWFNEGQSPIMHPVNYLTLDGVPGGHPTIMWGESDDWTINKYVIYRALMEDNSRPTHEDFDSLTFVYHPTTEFTDTTVLIHTENDNYKIWYAVTAMDEDNNESIKLDLVTFWGYYEDGHEYRFCEGVSYAQPAEFTVCVSPNPFNPITTISYQLPADGNVRLEIIDLAGRSVASLVNGRQQAGVHQATWNAAGWPSGIYFCRLTAGGFRQAQKLVLLK